MPINQWCDDERCACGKPARYELRYQLLMLYDFPICDSYRYLCEDCVTGVVHKITFKQGGRNGLERPIRKCAAGADTSGKGTTGGDGRHTA